MPNESTSTSSTETKPPEKPGREAIVVTEDSDDHLANQSERELGHASRSHVVTEEPAYTESAAIPAGGQPTEEPGKDEGDDDGDEGDEEPLAASADAGKDAPKPGDGAPDADGSDGQGDTKPKSRRARKMARVQKELADANERIVALEADAREAPPAKKEPTPEPEADDYPTWDKYADAKGEWIAEQKLAEAAAAAPADDADVVLPASWGEVSDKYEDFDTVIRGKHPVTKTMTDQLFGMEQEGAEVAYYLGQNPDEAKRIAALSGEITVARELAKLVGKATSSKPKGNGEQPDNGSAANVAPIVSNAPRPITGTEGGGAQRRTVDLNTADPEEYRRIRREQMKLEG